MSACVLSTIVNRQQFWFSTSQGFFSVGFFAWLFDKRDNHIPGKNLERSRLLLR